MVLPQKKEAGKWVKRVMDNGKREQMGIFNMHSPGVVEQAALLAGGPAWPP